MMKKIEKEKRRNKRTMRSHWGPRAIVIDKKGAAKRCNRVRVGSVP